MRVCKNQECLKEFRPGAHNQIYCSSECCKIVTDKKIMERYYEKKALGAAKRVCKTYGCAIVLSRYNKTKICNKCRQQKKAGPDRIARSVMLEITQLTTAKSK